MKTVGYQKGTWDELYRQTELLMNFGVNPENIITQPRYIKKLDYFYKSIAKMEKGTVLYIESLAHLAGSVDELFDVLNELDKRGIKIMAINEAFTNWTAFHRAIINILCGAFVLSRRQQDFFIENDSLQLIQKGFESIDKLYGKKLKEGL